MEAFFKNIGALEDKTKIFIQKWKEIQVENQQLIERNSKLEKENQQSIETILSKGVEDSEKQRTDLSNIQEALDQYIDRIDACIELLNIELNGK